MMALKTLIVIDDGKIDYWGRRIYRNLYTGKEYADVDGKLHMMTSEGEPLSPINNKVIYKDNKCGCKS
jgi:hypothetical protein